MRAGLGAAAAAAIFGSVVLGGVAAAQVHERPTVDAEALVDARGRTVEVTGTVDCDPGDRVRVVVTLMAGEVTASGNTRVKCDAPEQPWSVTVRGKGNQPGFEAGEAQVVVQAVAHKAPPSFTAGPLDINLVQAP